MATSIKDTEEQGAFFSKSGLFGWFKYIDNLKFAYTGK